MTRIQLYISGSFSSSMPFNVGSVWAKGDLKFITKTAFFYSNSMGLLWQLARDSKQVSDTFKIARNCYISLLTDNNSRGCSRTVMLLQVVTYMQARQTRPNSGGVAEGHPRFDKGGVAIIF